MILNLVSIYNYCPFPITFLKSIFFSLFSSFLGFQVLMDSLVHICELNSPFKACEFVCVCGRWALVVDKLQWVNPFTGLLFFLADTGSEKWTWQSISHWILGWFQYPTGKKQLFVYRVIDVYLCKWKVTSEMDGLWI